MCYTCIMQEIHIVAPLLQCGSDKCLEDLKNVRNGPVKKKMKTRFGEFPEVFKRFREKKKKTGRERSRPQLTQIA